MPLIRYLIGDVGVLADGPCPCGRGGVVLESHRGPRGRLRRHGRRPADFRHFADGELRRPRARRRPDSDRPGAIAASSYSASSAATTGAPASERKLSRVWSTSGSARTSAIHLEFVDLDSRRSRRANIASASRMSRTRAWPRGAGSPHDRPGRHRRRHLVSTTAAMSAPRCESVRARRCRTSNASSSTTARRTTRSRVIETFLSGSTIPARPATEWRRVARPQRRHRAGRRPAHRVSGRRRSVAADETGAAT